VYDDPFASALATFPADARARIEEALSAGPVIPADVAAAVAAGLDIEVGRLMMMLLPVAASFARVPISGYHVGAVALGMPPGSLYLGSNMEFTGQALSFCVHGEQSATNNAWLHGETGLQALAVNAAPCGYCRQFLYELVTATKGFDILLGAEDANDHSFTARPLTYYLPDAFGPQNLGNPGGLMEVADHGLVLASPAPLVAEALAAANASYSPYTFDYAGVAVETSRGAVYAGRYAESVAYNPSMSPLESALAFMSMNEAAQVPYDITAAVLVEATGSKASQLSATQAVLSSVAPGVAVQHVVAS
jgi:cytidine deaminase